MTGTAMRVARTGLALAILLSIVSLGLTSRVSPLGCVLVGMLAATLHRAVAVLGESEPRMPVRGERLADAPADQPFARLARLEDRISWGIRANRHFEHAVRPVLLDIAVRRLRRMRGADLEGRSGVARALIGDASWQLLTQPRPDDDQPGPQVGEIADLVGAITEVGRGAT